MIVNRLKKGESTLCTYTTDGTEIKEGDILGYGDNYPCVVLYNKFEGKFEAIEFGYIDSERYWYRHHDLTSCSVYPWKKIGNIDEKYHSRKLKKIPKRFDYMKDIEKYYT